jgi:hypothetical protein
MIEDNLLLLFYERCFGTLTSAKNCKQEQSQLFASVTLVTRFDSPGYLKKSKDTNCKYVTLALFVKRIRTRTFASS